MRIKVSKVAYHRNGIGGAGFHVVTFTTTSDSETKGCRMIGVLFDEPESVAVFDLDLLADNTIEFAVNSWRGADHFGPVLRKAIAEWEEEHESI